MSQELNPHLSLINGWYFDFHHMMANRQEKWKHGISNGHGLHHKFLYDIEGSIRKFSAHESVFAYIPFFDPPEEHYNDAINRAYTDYLFETQVLKP